jgi:hypothetical protein
MAASGSSRSRAPSSLAPAHRVSLTYMNCLVATDATRGDTLGSQCGRRGAAMERCATASHRCAAAYKALVVSAVLRPGYSGRLEATHHSPSRVAHPMWLHPQPAPPYHLCMNSRPLHAAPHLVAPRPRGTRQRGGHARFSYLDINAVPPSSRGPPRHIRASTGAKRATRPRPRTSVDGQGGKSGSV